MKRTLIYSLPFILLLVAGCLKPSENTVTFAPLGTFNGIFTKIRYNATKKGYDTTQAVISVLIDQSTGFAVSGDTTTHAASHGSFAIQSGTATFYDFNTSFPTKTHLNGTYNYSYDNANLQMQRNSTDTLRYSYSLRRQ